MDSSGKPLVSVVMPVYNGEAFLAIAIESILTQTFSDFELIIVDDASQDASAAIIRDFAERDDRIRFLQHERNRGEGGARNHGIAESRGEYIAGMDCDDISLPERLQMQVDFLQSHPMIGAVGVGQAMVTDHLRPRPGWIAFDERHAIILFDMLVGGPAIARNAIMARRGILARADGFKSDRLGSDYELYLRLVWETGIRYANLPALLYIYRRSDASVARLLSTQPVSGRDKARRDALEKLWGEAPLETLRRFDDIKPGVKLGGSDRRLVRRDYLRLIESMIDHGWVDADDRTLLMDEVNRRLEGTTPRLWQMYLHWRRHHFGR